MQSVYAYVRVSTVKQGLHGSSLQEQKVAIERYATQHNLSIIEWLEEQETAAKRGRPVFGRLVKLLRSRPGIGVIIHKIDRSARNLKDWSDLGELIDRGIPVHFAHESLDLQSRGGRLAADIQAVVAADYIRNLGDEVRKGIRGRLRQGIYPLPAPIGYLNQGKAKPKVPDPAMAPLVRQLFEIYATGTVTLRQLVKVAYDMGLRTRGGGRVSRNGLSTMLNNEFYCGVIHIRRTGERFPGIHESLVSPRLFQQVRAILQGRTVIGVGKHTFAYRRFLKCTACHCHLIGERQRGHVYYRCHSSGCRVSIREEAITAQAEAKLNLISVNLDDLDLVAAEFRRQMDLRRARQRDLIRSAELRTCGVEARLDRLTEGYLDGSIDPETYRRRQKSLLHEQSTAKESLRMIAGGGDPLSTEVAQFLEHLQTAYETNKSINPQLVRDLLKDITSNIAMEGKNLLVDWKNAYQLIMEREKFINSRPSRANSRSRYKLPQRATSLIKPLVQAIISSLEKECDVSWQG